MQAERKNFGAGNQKVKDANFSFMKKNLDHELSDTVKMLRKQARLGGVKTSLDKRGPNDFYG